MFKLAKVYRTKSYQLTLYDLLPSRLVNALEFNGAFFCNKWEEIANTPTEELSKINRIGQRSAIVIKEACETMRRQDLERAFDRLDK